LPVTITDVVARDIRFPTSQDLSGSDAMNPDPDYSAAYAILKTDSPEGLEGHGLTFTVGRGNEICVAAIEAMAPLVVGETLESLTEDLGASGAGSRATASSGGSGRRRASYTSPPPPSSTLSGTSTRRSRASPSGSSSST
jgi:L-alanine-DL-glutamate epimerase-like enolase superfamily enzyme